jgi:hypothetical protein
MRRLTIVIGLLVILSACATDPLLQRCYEDVQASDFPLGRRIEVNFAPGGIHRSKGRDWAIIPVKDQQGNADWLVCEYDQVTGQLLSMNSADVIDREVACSSPCRTSDFNYSISR